MNFALLAPRRSFYSQHDESILYARTFDDTVIVWLSLLFIISGLGVFFSGTRTERLLKYVMALVCFLFCCLPFLAVEEARGKYRMMAASTLLVVLYLFFAVQGWTHLTRVPVALTNAVLGIFAGGCIMLAAYHVHNWLVVPHVKELEIMSHPLSMHDNIYSAERIVVIRPEYFWSETFAPFLWEEFGTPTSFSGSRILPHRFRSVSMIHAIVRQMGRDSESLPEISVLPYSENPSTRPGDLVVDMTNFRTRLSLYRYIRSETSWTPIISGPFDVYLDKNYLYYTKPLCTLEDTVDRFFLHVVPIEGDDLPKWRKQHGFDNLGFDWHGVTYNERCFAAVRLPDYSIASIKTGQFTVTDMKSLWEGIYSP